ncbi:Protoglobin-domain-containing protein [Spinellus fusiger]|nr:Protoglobin-domain-containing protein [Spinellus fusiger]KAI7869215.1 Protoglobin-domain-containing protein [Spinellus fusiger]
MQHIDNNQLYKDTLYRFDYVSKFMDFGEADINAIQGIADDIRPLVPAVVDAVYVKLFQYDVTKKFFMPKNQGYNGALPASIEELTPDHPQIAFRKNFLTRYLNKILAGPYDEKLVLYLDWVAKIHTDTPEKASRINVDYIHINALLGFVETTLVGGVMSLGLERSRETAAIAAFNKLLWIQNDYFAKYYIKPQQVQQVQQKWALNDVTFVPFIVGVLAGALGVWKGLQTK